MVYSLLSMLGTHDKDDMSRTLLAMSSSQDSCIAMRQSGKKRFYGVCQTSTHILGLSFFTSDQHKFKEL